MTATLTTILDRLDGVRGRGNQYVAKCPAHPDRNPSLSITFVEDKVLVKCHAGCAIEDITGALGIPVSALFADQATRPLTRDLWVPCRDKGHLLQATYDYRDEAGKLLYQVVRCTAKCFKQRRPDSANPGRWKWNLQGVRQGVLYRLPELLLADPLRARWVVEGEKDADRLWSMGYPATCNSGGAGKWTQHHAQYLEGHDVIVCADRDVPGRQHAEKVVETLLPIARSIEVVIPARGKDISDHLDAGLGIGRLDIVAVPVPAPGVDYPELGISGHDTAI